MTDRKGWTDVAATRQLYYEDPYLTTFTARVVETGHVGGKPAIILDRTAFYPEGGGQPSDRGWLGEVRVLDVQKLGGKIWHILDKPLEPAPGEEIRGEIDWRRRFDFMQQHHGQHLLSAAFEEVLGAKTVSVHMGEKICTLDLDRPHLSKEEADAALQRANEMVWANVPVDARFVTDEELARLPLRNPPKVAGPVRIVSAGDFDHSPCGGTHPGRTGEVGIIVILRWERHREKIRVEFVCGRRALHEFRERNSVLTRTASGLSVGYPDLPKAIGRLKEAEEESRKALQKAKELLAEYEAGELLSKASSLPGDVPLVCARFDERSVDDLKRLAKAVTERGGVALLGAGNGTAKLVFARADSLQMDLSLLLREAAAIVGGRGGGKPDQAQGGGPDASRLAEALEHARQKLVETVRSPKS
jgi:alanyl-tRNA synthetase